MAYSPRRGRRPCSGTGSSVQPGDLDDRALPAPRLPAPSGGGHRGRGRDPALRRPGRLRRRPRLAAVGWQPAEARARALDAPPSRGSPPRRADAGVDVVAAPRSTRWCAGRLPAAAIVVSARTRRSCAGSATASSSSRAAASRASSPAARSRRPGSSMRCTPPGRRPGSVSAGGRAVGPSPDDAAVPAASRNLLQVGERYALLFVLIGVCIFFSVLPASSTYFATRLNFATLTADAAVVAVLAIASLFPPDHRQLRLLARGRDVPLGDDLRDDDVPLPPAARAGRPGRGARRRRDRCGERRTRRPARG